MIERNDDNRVEIPEGFSNSIIPDISSMRLIGRGGTSLVYRGRIDSWGRNCIVKEYYPQEGSNIIVDGVKYKRLEDGKLIVDGPEDCVKEEIIRREKRVGYENRILKELQQYDSNHLMGILKAEETQKEENNTNKSTLYTVMEIKAGNTMAEYVECADSLDFDEVIKLTKMLVSIIESVLTKNGYCHGDLKPDNIWIGNDASASDKEALVMYIIDFGSCFSYTKYQQMENVEDAIKEFMDTDSLGFSSDGYRSNAIKKLVMTKRFISANSRGGRIFPSAKGKFTEMMSGIDETSDLYSVIKMFYFMLSGVKYERNQECEQLQRYSDSPGVLNKVAEIMKKNENGEYKTDEDKTAIDKFKTDIDILDAIYHKKVIPEIWMYSVEKEVKELEKQGNENKFDEALLCSVKNLRGTQE